MSRITSAAFTSPEQHEYLAPLDGVDQFTDKLIGLLKNPEEQERMRRIGKEWVKRFSVDRVGEQFLEKIMG